MEGGGRGVGSRPRARGGRIGAPSHHPLCTVSRIKNSTGKWPFCAVSSAVASSTHNREPCDNMGVLSAVASPAGARRCRRPSRRPNARVSADVMLTSTASTVGCCAVRAASRGWSLAVAACTSDKVRTRSCGCRTSQAVRRMLTRWLRRRMLPRRRLRGIGPSSSTRGGGAWPT